MMSSSTFWLDTMVSPDLFFNPFFTSVFGRMFPARVSFPIHGANVEYESKDL